MKGVFPHSRLLIPFSCGSASGAYARREEVSRCSFLSMYDFSLPSIKRTFFISRASQTLFPITTIVLSQTSVISQSGLSLGPSPLYGSRSSPFRVNALDSPSSPLSRLCLPSIVCSEYIPLKISIRPFGRTHRFSLCLLSVRSRIDVPVFFFIFDRVLCILPP